MIGDEGVAHRVDVDEAERGRERPAKPATRDERPAAEPGAAEPQANSATAAAASGKSHCHHVAASIVQRG